MTSMTNESAGDYQRPDETTILAYDMTMRELYEHTVFERGIVDAVNNFIGVCQPQSFDSFIPVARMIESLADYMYEPGDDSQMIRTSLIQGLTTGLYVAHETYSGAMNVDDTLQSIADLCIPDATGRKNINQLVARVQIDVTKMSKTALFILADWHNDYDTQTGHEAVFNTGFAVALAGAHEKALQRHVEQVVHDFNWDSLLGGE